LRPIRRTIFLNLAAYSERSEEKGSDRRSGPYGYTNVSLGKHSKFFMERELDPMAPRGGDPTLPPAPEAEHGGDWVEANAKLYVELAKQSEEIWQELLNAETLQREMIPAEGEEQEEDESARQKRHEAMGKITNLRAQVDEFERNMGGLDRNPVKKEFHRVEDERMKLLNIIEELDFEKGEIGVSALKYGDDFDLKNPKDSDPPQARELGERDREIRKQLYDDGGLIDQLREVSERGYGKDGVGGLYAKWKQADEVQNKDRVRFWTRVAELNVEG